MKFSKAILYGLLILVNSNSCVSVEVIRNKDSRTEPTVRAAKNETERKLNDISLNGKVYSALWQQNAGEFRALCYQAFNVAKTAIDNKLAMKNQRLLAIVTDIDETFLDNSPYAVSQALKGKEFDMQSWLEWTSKAEAAAFPGSVDFYNYAASKNISVFYISNRNENDKAGTINNLKELGFPFADDAHVLVMKDNSNKEVRRKEVIANYDVFMFLGDNLSDFSEVFYHRSQQERNSLTDQLSAEFGSTFIVLPNSGYGDWEQSLPGFNSKLSTEEKDKVILKNVKSY